MTYLLNSLIHGNNKCFMMNGILRREQECIAVF